MNGTVPFWQRLSAAERDAVRAAGQQRGYPPGVALLNQGERSESAVILLRGTVKVEVVSREGRTTILGLREAGDLVGWQSAIDGGECVASVRGVGATTALFVPWPLFSTLARAHVGLTEALLTSISSRLREADESRIRFGEAEVTARLAAVILSLLIRKGRHTEAGVELRGISQDDLGALVAASRESVSRSLTALRRDGVLRTGRMRITVTDLGALRRLSEH